MLGVMANWSTKGTYRTMDNEYETRQLKLFQMMVENGSFRLYFALMKKRDSSERC